MSLNNVRAVGDDRPWKDEVERELKGIWDSLKYGKITLRASTGGTTGGGGGGGGGADLSDISATLPATYDGATYVVGVDQDAFDRIGNLDYAQFDVTTAAGDAVGRLLWDDTHGTLSFGLKGGLVDLQIGQEQVVRVRNATAGTLTKGTVCYFNGSNGTNFNVEKAIATGDSTSAQTMGVLAEELNTSSTQHGFITTFGLVEGVDLSYISGLAAGDQLYLDGTTAGRMTKTKPSAPIHLVYVGICLSAAGGGSNSTIFVKVQNGYELGEIHDVNVTGVTDGQVLAYDAATELWGPITVSGTGTVTSVDTGTGLTGGPITTSGTISLNASLDNLNDVTITGPLVDNELVAYNSATSQWTAQTADEAGIVQVYSQTTEPTGKVGDVWIDTSSEVNSWSSFMAYSMSAGTTGTVGAGSNVTVTFPSGRFNQIPIVTATANVLSSTNARVPHVASITSTSFTLYNVSSNTGAFNWFAVQISPTSGAG